MIRSLIIALLLLPSLALADQCVQEAETSVMYWKFAHLADGDKKEYDEIVGHLIGIEEVLSKKLEFWNDEKEATLMFAEAIWDLRHDYTEDSLYKSVVRVCRNY